jgi:hypothetical protein
MNLAKNRGELRCSRRAGISCLLMLASCDVEKLKFLFRWVIKFDSNVSIFQIKYKYLVVATGLQLRFDKVSKLNT